SINSTPGILRLLQLGGEPRPIPAAVVEAIRERVEILNAEGGFSRYKFHPGDPVSLRSGPLRGLQAVFIGPMPAKARVKVLLEFLGRPNEVQVDIDVLEPAKPGAERGPDPEPQVRGERRTRGPRWLCTTMQLVKCVRWMSNCVRSGCRCSPRLPSTGSYHTWKWKSHATVSLLTCTLGLSTR